MVHLRHLQLVVEVGHGAEALDDGADVEVAREVDQQTLEELDLHVRKVRGRLPDHLLPLFEVEQRLCLLRVADRGDDQRVVVRRGPFDDVEMPEMHGVERTWVDGDRQRGPLQSSASVSVTTVPPYRLVLRSRHPGGSGSGRSDSRTASRAGSTSRSVSQCSKAYGGSANATS